MSYLLFGQNTLMIDERMARLCAEIDPQQLNTTQLDVQQSNLSDIVAASQTASFFGGGRLVILRNPVAQRRTADGSAGDVDIEDGGRIRWADLVAVLKAAPTATTFIMHHNGSLAVGHYMRKAVRSLGWAEESFEIVYGSELLAWVTHRAREAGYKLRHDAAVELLNRLHPQVWQQASRFDTRKPEPVLIASEIEKLACASHDGVVDAADVAQLVADRAGFPAFKLNEVMFAGNTSGALVELQLMLEAGEPADRILGGIASEATARSAASQAKEFGSGNVANAAGITEGRVKMLTRRAVPQAATRRVAEVVRHADWAVKSGHVDRSSTMITPLIAEIAEVVHSKGEPPRR